MHYINTVKRGILKKHLVTTSEAYLEPSQKSTMELFCENS